MFSAHANSSLCEQCVAGQFRPGSESSGVRCTLCPRGFHQSDNHSASCLPCIPGTHQSNEGQAKYLWDGFAYAGGDYNRLWLESEGEGLFDGTLDAGEVQVLYSRAITPYWNAQAGVRYSLENPRAYIDSNIVGTFNVMEAARRARVDHLLMASTSSVYGANTEMPFSELEKADTQMTIYAATKKACELMAHTFHHLHGLDVSGLRFFTVYGPNGRPDMAPFKFIDRVQRGVALQQYGDGSSSREER